MFNKKYQILLVTALITSIATLSAHARSPSPFSKVSTVYAIKFSGFNIGTLKYLAKTNGSSFNMKSLTHVKLLGGIGSFNWKWTSNNAGRFTSAGVRPGEYNVTFTNAGKRQDHSMTFAGRDIRNLKVTPKFKYTREYIKIRDQHMKGVIDPLTAFLQPTLTRNRSGDPCKQSFSIFDGQRRFDVVMKPKRTQVLKSKARGAYRGKAHVCSARWIPIAGHAPDYSANKYMAANKTIEVYMIPVNGYDDYYAPYYITFQTPFGGVTIRSVYMEITTAQNKVISMLQK